MQEQSSQSSKNDSGNNTKLTDMQKLFLGAQNYLNSLAEKEAKGIPLTEEEIKRRDIVKEKLYASINKYAIGLSREIMAKYALPTDAYVEVQQAMACIFFEMLPKYNPRLTTPTTYFVRYFKQVISEYLRKDSQRLSQYDAMNVAKVRAAIAYFEEKGIKWDDAMLANRTKLSPKVLKQTKLLAHNSKYANIDDAIDLQSKMPTPEEAFIQSEKSMLIQEALQECLSEIELKVILTKFNDDYDEDLPYDEISKLLNIPIRDVKRAYSNATTKLRNNQKLAKLYSSRKIVDHSTLKFQDRAANILSKQILQTFGSYEQFASSMQTDNN